MSKILPFFYYKDPANTVEDQRWQEVKRRLKNERKRFREENGCGGCIWSEEVIKGAYLCQLGETPGKRGFCQNWWDIRTGKKPDMK